MTLEEAKQFRRELASLLNRYSLENGSNTSFVNRIVNENEPIDAIVADPVRMVDSYPQAAHPRIPAPRDIYMPERRNSLGVHLADGSVLRGLADRMQRVSRRAWVATPLVGGKAYSGPADSIRNPADPADIVGSVTPASAEHVRAAGDLAPQAPPGWDATAPAGRAAARAKTAARVEESMPDRVALCVREAG